MPRDNIRGHCHNGRAPVAAHLFKRLSTEWRAHIEEWHGHAVLVQASVVGIDGGQMDKVGGGVLKEVLLTSKTKQNNQPTN